ncbi:response regulator [Mucilaginibacter ginsenosidivorans]|uniref:Response regulator n=2 Tax=Mucilaginibacter ginsenosidivorans TaxID=398053 RepID=A0A5B8UTB9_9SPHI|nr:response regulator [Mucilaginibacter ginsenosidivorans]
MQESIFESDRFAMKKLIFIDDSPLDHFILKRILNKYNLAYEINCTANAEEVIGFLEKNRLNRALLPDVILLDIYMPEFNGWQFLEKVQRIYPNLSKPFKLYILSSSINPKDIDHAKQYNCVKSFVFKPITKEVLERLVDEEISEVK